MPLRILGVEAEGSEIQGHLQVHREPKASSGYIETLSFKTNKQKKTNLLCCYSKMPEAGFFMKLTFLDFMVLTSGKGP